MITPTARSTTFPRIKLAICTPTSSDTAARNAIALKEIPEKRFAVIRFSGMAGEESLTRYNKELNDFLSAKTLTPLSLPSYAFYNPPSTLPFLRRNEVLIEIAGPAN